MGVEFLGLLASIHFAHWRFVHTHHRVMSRIELKHFALACSGAFWIFDEGLALIRRFLTPDDHVIRAVFTALIASAVDIAIGTAIVHATVPPIARYFAPKTAPPADR